MGSFENCLIAAAIFPLRARGRTLGALTLALALVWVVVPGWTYNFADGRTP